MAAPYSPTNVRPGTQWNVESSYTASFVSPTNYLLKPEVRNKIFQAYDERALYDFLIHSGRTKVTGNTTYRWLEHDSYFHTHTVESVAGSAGAGNAATFTLEEVDHLATGTLSEIKKKDLVIVYTASGARRGYVTATVKTADTAHTVTVNPVDSAIDLVTEGIAGSTIVVFSSAASDGANMTAPTSRLPVEFYGYVQIIDTQKKTNGGESANVSFVEVDGKPYYYHQLVQDGDMEQRMKFENAAIFGQRGSETDPVTSGTAYLTAGLEWYADNEGYAEPYSGSFGLADLQNVQKNLDLEKAPTKQLFLVGNQLGNDVDDFVKGRLDNTAIDWSKMGIGSVSDRMIDFGVDGFRYGNFIFMKKKFGPLNTLGLTGGISASPYPKMGFCVSWDRVTAANGEEEDTICLRYKQNDRGSRFMRYWDRDYKITNDDAYEFNWKGEMGLQNALARHTNKVYSA